MKNILIIISFFPFLMGFSQPDIEGVWDTGRDNTFIQIYKSSGQFLGKVVSSDNEKAEPGMQVMRNIKKVKDHWEGEFYIPTFGKWMDVELMPTKEGLKVKVYVGWFSKSSIWREKSTE